MKMKIIMLLTGSIVFCNIVNAQFNPWLRYAALIPATAKTKQTQKRSFENKYHALNEKEAVVGKTTGEPKSAIHSPAETGYVMNKRQQRRFEKKQIRKEARLNRKIGELLLRMTGGNRYF